MTEGYISTIIDEQGQVWVYEGDIKGLPIWCKESSSNPKILTNENEAIKVAKYMVEQNETIEIRKVM